MRIAFWNTQRNPQLANVYDPSFWPNGCDLYIACEVLQDPDLQRQTISSYRQLFQLGYKLLEPRDGTYQIEEFAIRTYSELTGTNFWIAGGNAFAAQAKRPVARITKPGDGGFPPTFVYHSNASDHGAALTAWVSCQLCLDFPSGFRLLGDFNCDPDELGRTLTYIYRTAQSPQLAQRMVGLRVLWDRPTHNAIWGANRILDFAVCKGGAQVVQTHDGQSQSDHHPIVMTDEGSGIAYLAGAGELTTVTSYYRSQSWSAQWSWRPQVSKVVELLQ